ncbi:MAG TPA: subclass B3 metallo-beta-lactamase [Terriglobales bacterium]|nr:subclass B3 metallo-beta-lactamase [Terriglobales bacterium]
MITEVRRLRLVDLLANRGLANWFPRGWSSTTFCLSVATLTALVMSEKNTLLRLSLLTGVLLSGCWLESQSNAHSSAYLEAFPAHHVIANLYFVGSKSLGIYLVTTPKGHILINAGLEASIPAIQKSVESMGFRFSDIKILLISHAHWDHNAGAAAIKKLTHAKYMVMDADVPVVESGGRKDFAYGGEPDTFYPPAKVDRVLHDGDTVELGGTVLTAHLTPGHTKGCTTWTMKVQNGGKTYDVVIVGSPNVNPGYKLVNNPAYPEIASDYEKGFQVLRSLHCDVFLGAHGNYYDMEGKYARLKQGAENPFIDPEGYENYVGEREQAFRAELATQKAVAK